MPVDVERIGDEDLTVFTASGELTFAEQMGVLRAFYEDHPTRKVIWDFSRITGRRISREQLLEILSYTREQSGRRDGGRTALVAASELDFGLARMVAILAEGQQLPWQLQAFKDLATARAWIDEPPA